MEYLAIIDKKIEIIIITRNRPSLLKSTIKCLRRFEPYIPILILDNFSNKANFAELCKFVSCNSGIKLVRLKRNLFSLSRNIGAKLSKADFLFFLDDDVSPTQPFVQKTLQFFQKDSQLAVVTFALYDIHTKKVFTSRLSRSPVSFHDAIFALRKKSWEKVGGFPQNYLARGLVSNFSIRLLSNRYRLLYVPEIMFLHYGKRKAGGTRFHKLWKLPSLIGFVVKHFKLSNSIILSLKAFIGVLGLAAIEGWLHSVPISLLMTMGMLPTEIKERKRVQEEIEKMYIKGNEIRLLFASLWHNVKVFLRKTL